MYDYFYVPGTYVREYILRTYVIRGAADKSIFGANPVYGALHLFTRRAGKGSLYVRYDLTENVHTQNSALHRHEKVTLSLAIWKCLP